MNIPLSPPDISPLSHILPSEPILLMGAGPVPIPHAVARANSVVINHLGETMDLVVKRVKTMAQYAFQTETDKIFGVAGPASAAMEMALTNLLWPGKKVLILKNGTFSGRFGEMADGIGAEVTILNAEPAKPVDPDMVSKALSKKQYDVITMVQGETSCGVLNPEVQEIAKRGKEHGALVVVDAVCTLTTLPMNMDEWHIDVAITGGQKGLSSIPGVAIIAFSKEAWKTIKARPSPPPHWCYDALRAQEFWGHQQYHYTAPVPGILALHEALRLICEETLENRFERHRMSSTALQAGIEAMGLDLFVPKEYRLNSVVAINIPDHTDGNRARQYMAQTFHVEIAGAFGLDIVRIGQMGEQCRSHNLFRVLYAMGMAFTREGLNLKVGQGMSVLEENLVRDIDHFVP